MDLVEPVDSMARWASVDDYLMFRLTAQWVANPSNAAGMQLMDVSTRAWSDELCRLAGVDRSMLSPMVESGCVAGGLTADASDALAIAACHVLLEGVGGAERLVRA